jgi:putative transposase
LGVKRSLLVEGNGLPIAIAIEGANRHDTVLFRQTLNNIVVPRPLPMESESITRQETESVSLPCARIGEDENVEHMCLDRAYDAEWIRELLAQLGYREHIKSRGQEESERQIMPGYRARRWVVERTHSWLNRFRRLLIRWEKKAAHYLGLLHFACALIVFRALGIFG